MIESMVDKREGKKSIKQSALREVSVQNKNKHQCKAYMGTVEGQRGKMKLVLNGFAYIENKRIGDKTYWNCAQVRMKKCKARLITIGSMENIVVTHPIHSHEQEFENKTIQSDEDGLEFA